MKTHAIFMYGENRTINSCNFGLELEKSKDTKNVALKA